MTSKIKIMMPQEDIESQKLDTLNNFWGQAGAIIRQSSKSLIVLNHYIYEIARNKNIKPISLSDREMIKTHVEDFFKEIKNSNYQADIINDLMKKHFDLEIKDFDDKALEMIAPRFVNCNKEEALDLIASLAIKKLDWEMFPDNLKLIIKKGLFFTLTHLETKLSGKRYSVFVRAFVSGLIPFLYSSTIENVESGKKALWSLKDYEHFLLTFKPQVELCAKYIEFYEIDKDQRTFSELLRQNINPYDKYIDKDCLVLDELLKDIDFDLHEQIKDDENLHKLSQIVDENLNSSEELTKKTAYIMENIFGREGKSNDDEVKKKTHEF